MYCPKCKKEFDNSNVFCTNCGSKLIEKIVKTEESQVVEEKKNDATKEISDDK